MKTENAARKAVLITGCSSGFGRATALHFLEQGWNVIATMRSPRSPRSPRSAETSGHKPSKSLPDGLPTSERLRTLRLDVTDRASIATAVREAIAAFGGLDVVVNNAGIGLLSAFEATPEAMIREIFETNTFGVMAVTQAVVPHFRERRAGTLINVTSSVGIVPMPLVSVYTASKFAIEGFTESLSYELASFGIRTKIVEPGYGMSTSFVANGLPRMEGLVPEPYTPYVNQVMQGHGGGGSDTAPPRKSTNEVDVARAVWLAATDNTTRLRYAAGSDAEELDQLRRTHPGDACFHQMHSLVGPR